MVRRDEPRSLGDLVKQLATDTSTLARHEARLAQAEMAAKGKQAAVAGAMVSIAGAAGLLALLAAMLCLIAALATAMHVWLAALIVAGMLALIAAGLGFASRARLRRALPPIPEQAMQGLKEDVRWLKTRRHDATR